ncbi:MAG: PA14 domain-containing protein [bacterium]|nr:PA14 domain-containing protein [bacterium]
MLRKITLAAFLLALLSIAVVSPAAAQTNVVWSAQYYNNAFLAEPVTFTRQENTIAYNWGAGSPATNIPADNFSVRWATDVVLPAGTYRFWVLADDYVSVTVDFQPGGLINTFNRQPVGQLISQDITLNAGSHHIQVDYQELGGNAFVYVAFANAANNPQPPFGTAPGTPVNPGAPTGGVQPITTVSWSAQYYPNTTLSGAPTLIQSESWPSRDWGLGSPVASIPADGWSARWNGTFTLTGGTYQISVRPDDGVRVYVDGVLYINEWHDSTGATYSVTLPLIAGAHTIVIEFYENLGTAFLDFRLTQQGVPVQNPVQPTPQPTIQPGAVTATVTAFQLNVRNAPSATAARITRVNQGNTYAVLGQNPSGSWVQLNVNGTLGWVNRAYVALSSTNPLPIVDTNPLPVQQPVVTGVNVTATPFNVVIRNGPGTNFRRLASLPANQSAAVVGRNASNTWWQVNYNGIVGWVTAQYTRLNGDVNAVPVTQ